MRKMRVEMLLLIILLAVGFAAVSTTLVLTGNTGFASDASEFDVIFTKAVVDGVDKSNEVIAPDGKSISYTTKDLAIIDDTSVLDFTVTNNSTQYDAEVRVECVGGTNAGTYYTITKEVASEIPAQTEAEGKVTVTMIKSSVNEIEEEFTCTITANAKERETAAEKEAQTKITYSDEDSSGTKNIGDIVTISKEGASSESFYILTADEDNIQMMSMYNLYVGKECTSASSSSCTPYENATGIQDSSMIGWASSTPYRGATAFSSADQQGINFSDYEGSIVEGYVNAYSAYLSGTLGVENTATLISKEELDGLGCDSITQNTCKVDVVPEFIYSTSYWTRSANGTSYVWYVSSDGTLHYWNIDYDFGVRPVVTISANLLS